MPGTDTTLRGVVSEAIGETTDTPKPAPTNPTGASEGKPEDTGAGDTSGKEYVAGVDISDVPAELRPQIKAKLEEKAKLLEKGYKGKFEKVAKFAAAQDELVNLGLSVDEAKDVLLKHVELKRNPIKTTEAKQEATRLLDKLMESAPDAQKEGLQQLRTIVLEETNITKILADVEELKRAVDHYRRKDLDSGRSQVVKDLETTLTDKFGPEFVEKYRDLVLAEWEKHPNIKTKDILKYVADDDEYEHALLAKGKKPVTPEKKNAISSSRPGVSGTLDNVDLKKETTKSLISKIIGK